ncbi:MAG TPA: hypothetical protein VMN37_01520 [Gemmatimonadales bacterium]|nr:hypothetical protein [Gemmatimonadales bacterium]
MGLSRILLAWLAVTGWLIAWEAVARQVGRGATGPWVRPPLWRYAGEALLLSLLGALWFASLGAGAWWLVFALVGAIAAWPAPDGGRKNRRGVPRELVARTLQVARVLAAGGILAWRLGPA